MRTLLFTMAASAVLPLFADIAVSGWSQDEATSVVTVSYTLTGENSQIVTLDVLTNGVSIGGKNMTHISGDANKIVAPGSDAKTIH